MARAEVMLASKLKPVKVSDFPSAGELKSYLVDCIYERRKGRQKGLITELVSGSFDPDADFIKPICCPTITGIGLFDLSA